MNCLSSRSWSLLEEAYGGHEAGNADFYWVGRKAANNIALFPAKDAVLTGIVQSEPVKMTLSKTDNNF